MDVSNIFALIALIVSVGMGLLQLRKTFAEARAQNGIAESQKADAVTAYSDVAITTLEQSEKLRREIEKLRDELNELRSQLNKYDRMTSDLLYGIEKLSSQLILLNQALVWKPKTAEEYGIITQKEN